MPFSKTRTTRTVTYRLKPEVTRDGLLLHVRLEFQVGLTGTETLAMPMHWAGEELHAITNIRVTSYGASLDQGPATDLKVVHAPANRAVVISYDLKKDWAGPLVHPMQFHAVLMPEYVELTGDNALV